MSDKLKYFSCVNCSNGDLKLFSEKIVCINCSSEYKIKDNKIFFTPNYFTVSKWENLNLSFDPTSPPKPIVNSLSGPLISSMIKKYSIKGLAVNLGSGQDNHSNYVNVDLGDYENVDIVADISNTPFKNNSAQLVVSNSVLEHIYDYKKVVAEVFRILEKGGIFYLCVPSVCPRHHQYDYHRWTSEGLKSLIDDKFKIIEQGVARGIAHFLVTYVNQIIYLKFKNKFIRKIITVFLAINKPPSFFN